MTSLTSFLNFLWEIRECLLELWGVARSHSIAGNIIENQIIEYDDPKPKIDQDLKGMGIIIWHSDEMIDKVTWEADNYYEDEGNQNKLK